MIKVNLLTPGSIHVLRADLGRHIIMDSFLQVVLRAGGVELTWEYLGEVAANEEGVMVYVSLGRRLTKVEFVGQLTGGAASVDGAPQV